MIEIEPRRSALDWVIRATLAAGVCVAAYLTALQSFAAALPNRAIELAHRLVPFDARLTGELSRYRVRLLSEDLAKKRLSAPAVEERLAGLETLARQALVRDPRVVPAVSTLGLVAEFRADKATARRLHAYSERLSRRDLPTQMWMIEDAIARDDISDALRHYDKALRTKWGSWDVLVPVLAAASTDPAIGTELTKLLIAGTPWTENFLKYLAENTTDAASTARLFRDLGSNKIIVPHDAQAQVITKLLGAQQVDAAWDYYTSVRPRADRLRSRDANFSAMLEHPSQLDWNPVKGDTGITSSVQREGRQAVFDFYAPPSVGGVLLYQIQLLPPGRYMLTGRTRGVAQSDDSRPFWILTCTKDARELGRLDLPDSSRDGGLFKGTITVPPGCPAQYLALNARSSNALAGLSGQIMYAELRPVRPGETDE